MGLICTILSLTGLIYDSCNSVSQQFQIEIKHTRSYNKRDTSIQVNLTNKDTNVDDLITLTMKQSKQPLLSVDAWAKKFQCELTQEIQFSLLRFFFCV